MEIEDLIPKDTVDRDAYIKSVVFDKIQDLLQKDWINFNQFLDEYGISVLPDTCYKDGKKLSHIEVKKLYAEWLN